MTDALRDDAPEGAEEKRRVHEMRLRPSRAPVTRLSRKVLTALALVAAAGLGGALIFALQPHRPAGRAELYNTDSRSTPDGLANLPKDYTGLPRNVPKLGPPLPGDLGRPIVNAGAPAPGTAMSSAAPASPDPEKQRLAQEKEAARTGQLFAASNIAQSVAPTPADSAAVEAAAAPNPAASSQDHKLAFLRAKVDHRTVSSERIEAPASPYVVQAGAVIPAALITGLRSDLPGQITAQVTQDVYDSPTGAILLIPQGARLVGEYDAQIAFGQSRALLVWNRLIMPGGRSIVLERQPGADPQGYAGLSDRVDNHWRALLKGALLSTVLSVGSQAGASGNENSLVQALRQGASDSISQTDRQIVQRSLNVQPTLTIRQGFPVTVIVTRDLVLEPYSR